MTRSKLGLLGFCAVVLGLMAFNAASAFAEEKANWLILMSNSEVLTGAQLTASVGLKKVTTGVLHSKILGLTTLYECNKIEAINANLLKNGTVAKEFNAEVPPKPVGAQIKFSECIAIIGGEVNASCKPKAGGTEEGVIKTNPGHGLIVLHEPKAGEKVELVQILPDTGETFATIESEKTCPVGAKVPVIGKAFLKDCGATSACTTSAFLTHSVEHLTTVGPLTELWTISKTTEHVATILGVAGAFLQGAHLNLSWAGDPA
jgi:hypothetical protein